MTVAKKTEIPAGTGKQTPTDPTPDNPQFQSHETEVREALKLVEDGGVKAPEVKAPQGEQGGPVVPLETKKEEPPQTGPTAKGWAAIAKAEKKLQDERSRFDNEMKAQRHELNQMKAQMEQLQGSAVDLKGAFKKDPFGTLKKELGLSFNDLAQLALEDDPTEKLNRLTESGQTKNDPVVQKLLEKIEGLEKTFNNQTVQRELENYRGDIKRAVSQDDLSILTTMPNLENEVLTLAGEYHRRTGERLSADKACGILAKYWEQHLQSLGSHAAARRVLGLPDPEAVGAPKKPTPKGPTKTLTNRQLASPPADGKLPDNLSDEEELRLAAKLVPDDAWAR